MKEQVQSLGATFVEVPAVAAEGQGGYARELGQDEQARVLAAIGAHLKEMDLVITTAAIPGKEAPRLVTAALIASMRPGSVPLDLAAEADVPYDRLKELEEINGEFRNADVALVIGANDVVNPAARSDRSSPIYGMPILDVDHARHVIVLKRSMKPGFAGVETPLFHAGNTSMLFGDAKASLARLVHELKQA